METEKGIHVVKLGGSLLDLPDLVPRFERWRAAEAGPRALLVVGGGPAADLVRAFNSTCGLDELAGHWLAVRAMRFNGNLMNAVLPRSRMAEDPVDCQRIWTDGYLAIAEAVVWLRREEARGVAVPHRWSFTSDSISALIATRLEAARLTLLKSALPISDCSPSFAAGAGIVDGDFPEASAAVPRIELVNLRSDPLERRVLR